MVERFQGRGNWENIPVHRVLMSLIRRRPRDLVKLCTLAGRESGDRKSVKIATEHFNAIFSTYSQGRLQDTINEFKTELPTIERLLMSMKPVRRTKTSKESYVYSMDALVKKIKNIQEQGRFCFAGTNSQLAANANQLANFMYKINFLTARKDKGDFIERMYFEENRLLANQFTDFGFEWEIHPAYRWALQPDDLQSIFLDLKPTE
jgi:hypothetical protein